MNESIRKTAAPEPHPDIKEILAKRRETLDRVRADLRKVDQIQNEFWRNEDKGASDTKAKRP